MWCGRMGPFEDLWLFAVSTPCFARGLARLRAVEACWIEFGRVAHDLFQGVAVWKEVFARECGVLNTYTSPQANDLLRLVIDDIGDGYGWDDLQ